MGPIKLANHCQFSQGKFLPQLLYGSPGVRIFLLCLEPGQALPVRADSEEMVCFIVAGRAALRIGEEVFTVTAGELAGARPGEVRGLEAIEQSLVLWLQINGKSRDE